MSTPRLRLLRSQLYSKFVEERSLIHPTTLTERQAGSDYEWLRHDLQPGEDINDIRHNGLKNATLRAADSGQPNTVQSLYGHTSDLDRKFKYDPDVFNFSPVYSPETGSHEPSTSSYVRSVFVAVPKSAITVFNRNLRSNTQHQTFDYASNCYQEAALTFEDWKTRIANLAPFQFLNFGGHPQSCQGSGYTRPYSAEVPIVAQHIGPEFLVLDEDMASLLELQKLACEDTDVGSDTETNVIMVDSGTTAGEERGSTLHGPSTERSGGTGRVASTISHALGRLRRRR
ncbi:uncharacterized protein I303_102692 [Kwoniella dejecticola CBS 10117]|uniref:Uncharacterized protein n=1 Tax=Kwoniella dejecticola CBS 10117 TaxID=1296121 RepID=A0A1A6A9G8_9TREE|nr:uncharacterized protein I303_02708 [Kwoniella dejecticola CBS 10117]OBR86696.1 hypothetical protein I303_02708 [Kwoniella dejecticola CBS 10117]